MQLRHIGYAIPIALAGMFGQTSWAQDKPVTITLLHLGDLSEISPDDGIGGAAEVMTLLRSERERNTNAITTFGGDLISPSLLSGITKGEHMIDITNGLGFDVAVLGNHEFDFGPEIASERVAASNYPWLGTNVRDPEGKPAVSTAESWIKEIDGYSIGFVGFLTPDTVDLASPGDTVTFGDPVDAANEIVPNLKERGADLVVALTHLPLQEDRRLLRYVDDLDIVLGGHDHTVMALYDGGKLVAKAGEDGEYLAVIDIALSRDEDEVEWIPSWRHITTVGVDPDPEIKAIVDQWAAQLDKELDIVIGTTESELVSQRAIVRTQESTFGNLVADSMREATGADIAITNGGGIRADKIYEPGTELKRRDILSELPFGNVTVVVEMNGALIKDALENGVSRVEETAGRFPQVSGLTFTFDATAEPGSRVTEISVDGAPIDDTATFTVATNDYMLSGGDGYDAFAEGTTIVDPASAKLMASQVIDAIESKGSISPRIEGRITRIN